MSLVLFVDEPEAHVIDWSFTLLLQLHRVILPALEQKFHYLPVFFLTSPDGPVETPDGTGRPAGSRPTATVLLYILYSLFHTIPAFL